MTSPARPYLYFELLPPDHLRPYVDAFWGFDIHPAAGTATHTVWPDACISLLCRFHDEEPTSIFFTGPCVTPIQVQVHSGERYRGIRLRPHTGGALLGCDPGALRDRSGPAAELLTEADLRGVGASDEAAPFTALEAVLTSRVPTSRPLDRLVGEAVEALVESRGLAEIGEVAASLGISPRQLRRRFRAATGVSPKEFARVRRLRAAMEERVREGGQGWARVAARFGFADQSHLIHEIARMTGLTPGALDRRLLQIEHDLGEG